MKLIQSDSVLRPVVQQFKLRLAESRQARKVHSDRAQDAPVTLPSLAVTRPPNSYLHPDQPIVRPIPNWLPTSPTRLRRAISTILTRFAFRLPRTCSEFMTKGMDELRAKMESSSAKLAQFEKELNVINPEEKTSILSARLLQLNTDYTTAQSDRVKIEAVAKSVRSGSMKASRHPDRGRAIPETRGPAE